MTTEQSVLLWGDWFKSTRLQHGYTRIDLMMALHHAGVEISSTQIIVWESNSALPQPTVHESLVSPLSSFFSMNPTKLRQLYEANRKIRQREKEHRTDVEAIAEVASTCPDFLPSSPYPGMMERWKGVHTVCGKTVYPRLSNMSRGVGCCWRCGRRAMGDKQSISEEEAIQRAYEYCPEFQPTSPYPGHVDAQWQGVHVICDREIYVSFHQMQNGHGCCNECGHLRTMKIAAKKTRATSGKYVGVAHDKRTYTNPYVAQVCTDGKVARIGGFPTAIEAAHARDNKLREHGEYPESVMNFPIPSVGCIRSSVNPTMPELQNEQTNMPYGTYIRLKNEVQRNRSEGKFTGVKPESKSRRNPWVAYATIEGKKYTIPCTTYEEAAHKRDDIVREHDYPESLMNFPLPRVRIS